MSVEDAEKSAAIYAWEYFKYHAAQRQSVFRFYLTLIGAATIAYAYSQRFVPTGSGAPAPTADINELIGTIFMVASFLFWSLDKRSRRLIKLAEEALKN